MSENYRQNTKDELIEKLEKTLEERDFFRAILDGVDETIELYSREGELRYFNRALLKHAGITEEEAAHFNPAEFVDPEDLGTILRVANEVWNGPVGTTRRARQRFRHKDGHRLAIEFSLVNQSDPPLKGLLGVGRVLAEESDYTVTWEEVDEALSAIFNGVHDAIFVHDKEGRIIRLNSTSLEMFGIEALPGPLSMRADHYYGPMEPQESMEEIWEEALAGHRRICEWKAIRHDDGSVSDLEVVFSKIGIRGEDLILVVVRDVSERKEAEEKLRAALREKEALLREVHHRVKNNLSAVSSLLRLQARRMNDKSLASLFAEADFRVRCIGMVHEKLYQSKSIGHLSVREYLNSLLDHLLEVYGKIGRSLTVNRDIEEVSFEPDTALPLGFIASELVSNALKHAFPKEGGGEIMVSLRLATNQDFELVVSDNGVGIPAYVDLENPVTLGLVLVRTFSRQLRGTVDIIRNKGTEVRVKFRGDVPRHGR